MPRLRPDSRSMSARVRSGKPAGAAPGVGRLQQLVDVAIGEVGITATELLVVVVHHLALEVGDRHFALAAAAAPLVVGSEHLVEVLGFELLALLHDLSRRPQPQLLEPRAGEMPADVTTATTPLLR